MKMINKVFYFSIILLMATFDVGLAGDAVMGDAAGDIRREVIDEAPVFISVDAGDEENMDAAQTDFADAPQIVDERIRRIENDAAAEIRGVVTEIDMLADRSEEAELQKEIERIKLDAEIARLRIYVQDAEAGGYFDIADEYHDQIDYLEKLNEPVIGLPVKQPEL
jgi:hypothetical protein